jgi:lysophospholipase L1-like esterase
MGWPVEPAPTTILTTGVETIMKLSKMAVLAAVSFGVAQAQTADGPWVQTFELSPAAFTMRMELPETATKQYGYLLDTAYTRGTLRYRFAVSVGGTQVRIRFSNEVGTEPLHIGAASIALAADGANAKPGTIRRLTFNGKESITVAAGAPAVSDPVDLIVQPLSELIASWYVDQNIPVQPLSGASLQRVEGDRVMDASFDAPSSVMLRPAVSGVFVNAKSRSDVVVALGDSITDGARSKSDVPHGWVDQLARRMFSSKHNSAFVSAGIEGNRVLRDGLGQSALARADRDAFTIPGVKEIILLEGINDIGLSGQTVFGVQPALDVSDLITGYEQIAARAHLLGLKIYIGTLTPFRGSFYFSEEKEKIRLAANSWIRSNRVFDGVVDFDKTLGDPSAPDRLNKAFDSGDHLHPSDEGYKAMANAVPVAYFK